MNVLEATATPHEGLTGDLLCVILGLMYKSFSLGFPLFGFKIRLPCCTTPCINENQNKYNTSTNTVDYIQDATYCSNKEEWVNLHLILPLTNFLSRQKAIQSSLTLYIDATHEDNKNSLTIR